MRCPFQAHRRERGSACLVQGARTKYSRCSAVPCHLLLRLLAVQELPQFPRVSVTSAANRGLEPKQFSSQQHPQQLADRAHHECVVRRIRSGHGDQSDLAGQDTPTAGSSAWRRSLGAELRDEYLQPLGAAGLLQGYNGQLHGHLGDGHSLCHL